MIQFGLLEGTVLTVAHMNSLCQQRFSLMCKQPTDRFNLYFAAYEPELLDIGMRYPVTILERSRESAEGEQIEVIMNYLDDINEDIVVFINACCPFMQLGTVESAVDAFVARRARSLTAVTRTHTWYYFEDGTPVNFPNPSILNTKFSVPLLAVAHTFHIFERKRFLENHYFWEHGSADPVLFEVNSQEAIDIDTELDFEMAEALYRNRRSL